MEIIIGKTAGFCFGVANAVNKTEQQLKEQGIVFCLGDLVHNKEVTKELEDNGLIIIDNIEKAKQNVIIRAHGEPEETYKKADELNLEVLDFTCPKVKKIHKIASEYSKNGFYILLIGQKNHPETIGTISYCGESSEVIEKEEDIEKALNRFYSKNINKLLVIAQTTFSLEKFNNICLLIKEKIESKQIELEIKKTICDATRLRQEETQELAKKVDAMIIIGGKHSSNTNKLFEIAKKYCKKYILVETCEDIEIEEFSGSKIIGIMAGASTPKKSIDSVLEKLKCIC